MKRKLWDKQCLYCWKIFRPVNATRKYCSPSCAQKDRIILRDHICEFCWEHFKSKKKEQKYCGIECQHKSYRIEKECKKCGQKFFPDYGTQEKCNSCTAKKTKVLDKACEICGKIFHPKRNAAKYCSNKCKNVAKVTLKDVVCPTCWKLFHQLDKKSKYCSMECFYESDLWRNVPQKITKPNLYYRDYLESLWHNVTLEKRVWKKSYDLGIWNIVIEINPFAYHNSTWFPYRKWKPKPTNYHQIRMQYAILLWYKCIMIWDWTTKEDVIKMVEDGWFHYEGPPRLHRYNWKTKEHIINNGLDRSTMINNWFVEIWDCWKETFTT